MQLITHEDNCSGCGVCKLACALANFKEVNPAKAALKVSGGFPAPGTYTIAVCNQCGECAEACPVEAITEQDGAFIIDYDECIGCMSCVDACPLGVMFEHPAMEQPIKCTNCGECAESCPRGALEMQA